MPNLLFSRKNGRDRLLEMLGPNVVMCLDSSTSRSSLRFSFPCVIVPLIRALTAEGLRKSVMREATNALYALLHSMASLELRLSRLFDEWTQRPIFLPPQYHGSGRSTGREAMLPTKWEDAALPIALLMREAVNRIAGASAEAEVQEAFDLLSTAVARCEVGTGRW